jgi:hypothetical protein
MVTTSVTGRGRANLKPVTLGDTAALLVQLLAKDTFPLGSIKL